jgi:SPOR domain
MKQLLFISTALLLSVISWCQTTSTDTLANGIEVTKDARLDLLVKKQFEINERANKLKDNKGFRIMVLNTNNRDEALKAKSVLLQNFPEQKPYLAYQPPYFKLKFGDFKTKEDAVDYQKKLKPFFPKGGLFIVPDKIEVKLDKEDKLKQAEGGN